MQPQTYDAPLIAIGEREFNSLTARGYPVEDLDGQQRVVRVPDSVYENRAQRRARQKKKK